ncbi:unnamed protein product [Microthlaspi erraticum]|uniref:Fatty acid desaturase domain-containing protein n=1 Tax=Microthlaspi erraticum TaxID=1685480 RepID=A0A6D2KU41_9BRAS|nr:unnamed protein product [Microthlaspi erraticum]
MAFVSTTLKPLSPFSPFVKQHNRNSNTYVLLAYQTPNSTNSLFSKRGGSVANKKHTFVAVHDAHAPDQVESSWTIPLSEVVVVRKKRAFWERGWNSRDVRNLVVVVGVHLMSLLAPFYFNWVAFKLFIWLFASTGLCITLSFHRNLSHRSFALPKWLEYLFAYGGFLAFQGDPIEWVSNHRYHHKHCETERDPHSPTQGFWFSHMTWLFDTGSILKKGVATVFRFHAAFLVNSVSHIWGTRAWNTPDFSKNNWWIAIITFGEGWHNNHHVFEFSARHGLEWWQLDVTWYLISFLGAIGLATDVKLPTDAQKKRMSWN